MIMSYMEPREPTCPRCGAYADEDDIKYCECGAELDAAEMENKSTVMCPECGHVVTHDTIRWRCPHCGFDGRQRFCVVCNTPLRPKETDMCERCQREENRAVFEDTWNTAFDEYFKNMYENEGGK
jgi:RecJ-like exonuclease